MRSLAWAAALIPVLCAIMVLAPATSALASAPSLAAVSPNNGPLAGGEPATLAGSGFLVGGTTTVRFASVAAAVQAVGQSEIRVTVPPGARSELVNVTVTNSSGTSAVLPKDQFAYDSPPAARWLGLDGNSGGGIPSGQLGEFVSHGIVYDRGGAPGIDWMAGEVLSNGSKATASGMALATSVRAGMIPDVVVEYRGYKGNYTSDPSFPRERTKREEEEGRQTIREYVAGFVKSAKAIHEKYPSAVFEPMNEPWGYTTPQYNGAEYANVIASLLPEAQAAGLPLSSVYVGATGKGCPAAPGACTSNGWVPAMYGAQASLTREIQGWYLHPYGPPNGVGEYDGTGIQSVPVVQAAMTSGQNNVIVSEIGYCARVNAGRNCRTAEKPAKAARHLTEMLRNALPYHDAGWLRALIVYARTDGGWAMQFNGSATLTRSGEALDAFADAHGSPSSIGGGGRRRQATRASLVGGVSCTSYLACAVVGDLYGAWSYLP